MVPEALRRVQEPVMQTTPRVVQKQQGEGKAEEARFQQKAEKENLIQNLNSDRGAKTMFFFPTKVEIWSPHQAREDQEFPQKKWNFSSCLGTFLKVPIPRQTNHSWLQLQLLTWEMREKPSHLLGRGKERESQRLLQSDSISARPIRSPSQGSSRCRLGYWDFSWLGHLFF